MIEGIAQLGSVHQPGPWIPTRLSAKLTIPVPGFRSQRHISATTTQLVTTGRK